MMHLDLDELGGDDERWWAFDLLGPDGHSIRDGHALAFMNLKAIMAELEHSNKNKNPIAGYCAGAYEVAFLAAGRRLINPWIWHRGSTKQHGRQPFGYTP